MGEPMFLGWDTMGLAEGETLEMGPDTPKRCPELGGPMQKEKRPGIAAGGEGPNAAGRSRQQARGVCSSPPGGREEGKKQMAARQPADTACGLQR